MSSLVRLRAEAARTGRRRWVRRVLRGSRPQLAIKSALAAGIAWQAGLLLPGAADNYPYYAPLGAVIAMYPTLASSASAAVRSLLGVCLGVAIAIAASAFAPPSLVTIAAVVGVGVLIGGSRVLGDQRSWVPMTALFVLIIGDANQSAFVLGYVGQLLLGAGIGTAINLVLFPPLFLADAREHLEAAQEKVAFQLRSLAEGLELHTEPRGDAWADRTTSLEPRLSSMRQALYEVEQAQQANPRARRYRRLLRYRTRQAAILERVGRLVDDLTAWIIEVESREVGVLPLGNGVRPTAARALRQLAELTALVMEDDVLRDGMDGERLSAAVAEVSDGIESLIVELDRHDAGHSDRFAAAGVVNQLRRCVRSFELEGLAETADPVPGSMR